MNSFLFAFHMMKFCYLCQPHVDQKSALASYFRAQNLKK